MNQIPIYLALTSVISFWILIAKKLGWLDFLGILISDNIRINDKFGILVPVILSFVIPFLVAKLSSLLLDDYFEKMLSSNLLPPTATLCAASVTAFMAYQTIKNNRRNERIKSTISALNDNLFRSENLTKFESACTILSSKLDSVSSFKALCRLENEAKQFFDDFRKGNSEEYETIRDILKYADNLCYGAKVGIYDQEMLDRFLGDIIFEAWWSAMIIIRHEEFNYYREIDKDYRRKPDFGSPYKHLYSWIVNISERQNLQQLKFVLVRLDTGINYREEFRKLDELVSNLKN